MEWRNKHQKVRFDPMEIYVQEMRSCLMISFPELKKKWKELPAKEKLIYVNKCVNPEVSPKKIQKLTNVKKSLSSPLKVPLKPMQLFMHDMRSRTAHIQDKDEKMRHLSRLWEQLPQKERDGYLSRYNSAVETYQILKEEKVKLSEITIKKEVNRVRNETKVLMDQSLETDEDILSQKPVKPISYFLFYTHSTENDPRVIKEMWKSLPADERNKWIELARSKSPAYYEELMQWENKMIEIGRKDLVRWKTLMEKHNRKKE